VANGSLSSVFRGVGGEGEPGQHGLHEGLHLQGPGAGHRSRQLTRQITSGKNSTATGAAVLRIQIIYFIRIHKQFC
jgi:hypothetical protein